jgi:hypothetical protein
LQESALQEGFVLSTTSRTFVAVALSGLLLLAGCRSHTAIADINKDPAHYLSNDVTISGTVSSSFSALGNGIFGVPGNGNKVSVTGRVEQGISFAGRSFGTVLRQTEAAK